MGRRVKLTVAYDGSSFHGFAENHGVETVAGTVRSAIERVVRSPIEMVGAGRTDAGVHAWGQVVSFDLAEHVDLANLAHRLNRLLSPRIVIRDYAEVAHDFSARFSAEWRHYRYTVHNAATVNPFTASTTWHVPVALDIRRMNLACDPLIGEHDFASFCRRPAALVNGEPASLVRRILFARWSVPDPHGQPETLRFEIRATAFCHQMVRSITGTLVEVGLAKRRAGDLKGVLEARSRSAAGAIAPPHGLCLWEVGYPTDRSGAV